MSSHEVEHRSADTNSYCNRIHESFLMMASRVEHLSPPSSMPASPIPLCLFEMLMGARELDFDTPCMSDGLLAKHLAVSILPPKCPRKYHSHKVFKNNS